LGFYSIHLTSPLALAGVLAQEGSKENINIACWVKGLAEALKASGFKMSQGRGFDISG
jgi:hypothetical protein